MFDEKKMLELLCFLVSMIVYTLFLTLSCIRFSIFVFHLFYQSPAPINANICLVVYSMIMCCIFTKLDPFNLPPIDLSAQIIMVGSSIVVGIVNGILLYDIYN